MNVNIAFEGTAKEHTGLLILTCARSERRRLSLRGSFDGLHRNLVVSSWKQSCQKDVFIHF